MASCAGMAFAVSAVSRGPTQGFNGISSQRKFFPSIRLQPAPLSFRVAAKPETVKMISAILKQYLVINDVSDIAKASFSELGVDSLDKIEILLDFEDAFGISIREDLLVDIVTVEDAANMIDELVRKNMRD